jgi:tRNA pseudouridine38-40 synthase
MTDVNAGVRIRLDLAYDGTDFAGWAVQPGLRTVQGTIEDGLSRLMRGVEPRLTVAGRTDAGVHARGQVAHVDLPMRAWEALAGRSHRDPETVMRTRLSGVLPPDIVVLGVKVAPSGFDARFSARERRYVYRVSDRPESRDPLTRRYVFWYPRSLDVTLLREASRGLTGLRDFAPFCRSRERATTIRTLVEFSWERVESGVDEGLVTATFRADAFCHSMVRSLVGAVLAVGDGRRDLAWLRTEAVATSRRSGIIVAPPHGLTLEEVAYPPDDELAERANSTRAKRTLD